MLPLTERQLVEILLAALVLAIGLVGELYDRLGGGGGQGGTPERPTEPNVVVIDEREDDR